MFMRRLTLVLALTAGALATTALADQEVSHPFDTTTPSRGVRRVVFDIPAGELHIRNGAGGAVGLHGSVRRNYDGYRRRDENQRVVDDTAPEVVIKGDEAVIRRRFGSKAIGWSARNKSFF